MGNDHFPVVMGLFVLVLVVLVAVFFLIHRHALLAEQGRCAEMMSESQKNVNARDNVIHKQKDLIDELAQKNRSLSDLLDEFRKAYSVVEVQLARCEREREDLKEKFSVATRMISSMSRQLETERRNRSEVEAKLAALERDRENLKKDNSDLIDKLGALTSRDIDERTALSIKYYNSRLLEAVQSGGETRKQILRQICDQARSTHYSAKNPVQKATLDEILKGAGCPR